MRELLDAAIRDPGRLAALRKTALLDARSEAAFDRLTSLVCRVLTAPVALVALVDEDHQLFKSHVGLPEPFASIKQTPLTHSFCKHVVLTSEPLVVHNAREHPELKDNPAIEELGIVAYLGFPLSTADGHVLGSLCAIDHEEREWKSEDIEILRDLAASVMTEIELRLAVREADDEKKARTALLESTAEGIYGIDTEGRCTFLNRAGSGILGYSPEAVLGENMHQLIHHSHADGSPYAESECPIFRAFREGEGVRIADEVLWRRDGRGFPAEYSSFPIREGEEILGAVVSFTDLTERRRTEEEARRMATRLDTIMRQIAEGVIFTDVKGEIVFVNEAAREIHGVAELGVPVEEYTETYRLFTPEGEPYPPEELPLARAVRRGETVLNAEWRTLRPDGVEIFAQGSASPIRAPDGAQLGAVLTIRDVTEQKRAERERERLLQSEQQARERITAILESITDAFFALDREWRFTYLNPQAERLLERPREELLGRILWQEFPEAVDSAFSREYHRAVEEQMTAEFEEFYPPLNSWLEVRAYPSDEGLSVYFRDVTERRRAEEERKQLLDREREARAEAERRAREEAALSRAAETIAHVFTIDEIIDEIARGAIRAVDADAVIVERIDSDVGHAEVVAAMGSGAPPVGSRTPYPGSLAERVVERGESELIPSISESSTQIPGESIRMWPNGSALVVPLIDAGEAIGALILVRSGDRGPFQSDEIERARTFADLAALAFRKVHLLDDSEKKREELERVMESRARLMRGFTHDLKNPLGAADGHLQLLELGVKGELTPEHRESIVRARASLRSTLGLIEDLVQLAQAEAGRLEISPQPVDVREIARELSEDYRAHAESKGLRIQTAFPDELPLIQSDASRVRQILGNLISNAIKYTNEGEIAVRVDVREDGDCIAVEVSDTGRGIPEAQLPLLFNEFSRLSSDDQPGAGLGLAISQRIAHALGGRITVETEHGAGSTFTVWFPVR